MSNSTNSGISFFGMLTILFIGLKLTHYIDWSWWYVLLPLWGPVVLVVTCAGLWFLGLWIVDKF